MGEKYEEDSEEIINQDLSELTVPLDTVAVAYNPEILKSLTPDYESILQEYGSRDELEEGDIEDFGESDKVTRDSLADDVETNHFDNIRREVADLDELADQQYQSGTI